MLRKSSKILNVINDTTTLLKRDSSSLMRRYYPRRAMLYIPGSDPHKLGKASKLNVDCVCLDLEDGVALNHKEEARQNVSKILSNINSTINKDVSVRVNSVSSGLCKADLEGVLEQSRPNTIFLPKMESSEELQLFFEKVENLTNNKTSNAPIGLGLFVESALALMNLPLLCSKAFELATKHNVMVPEVLVMGSDDYLADIEASRSRDALELLYARQRVVCVAKAFGMQAIDMVHIDLEDETHLARMSRQGMEFGFNGKQVIHPGQVEVVTKAFTPSKERLEWAEQLINEFARAEKGAFVFRGQMIDMPTIKQASNLLRIKENIQGATQ